MQYTKHQFRMESFLSGLVKATLIQTTLWCSTIRNLSHPSSTLTILQQSNFDFVAGISMKAGREARKDNAISSNS
jgi:hypothetical protein